MGFETFIAKRYLRSPRKDRSISIITKFSVGGVAMGVMALIIALSMMNGFERDIRGQLQRANGHLTVLSYAAEGFTWQEDSSLVKQIKKAVDIKALAPFTLHQAFIMGRKKSLGTLVKGINSSLEPQVIPMNFFVRSESFEIKRDNTNSKKEVSQAERREVQLILSRLAQHLETVEGKDGNQYQKKITGIILGSQLAKNLGVDIDDWVTVLSLEARITPMGEVPKAKRFKVVGFYESGLMGFDEFISIMDIEISQKIFRMKDRISGLTLRIENGEEADEYKKKLEETIGFPYIFNTWIEENKNIFAMFRIEKLVLAISLTLIILIAAFNIISSLVMLVTEKSKDIAVLKAVGAKNKSIRKIFMMQGTAIGLTGTIIGVVLGLLICWIIGRYDIFDLPPGVYVGNRIPMYVEIWQIFLIAVISMVICITVTILPSQNASKLDPVAGLRNE